MQPSSAKQIRLLGFKLGPYFLLGSVYADLHLKLLVTTKKGLAFDHFGESTSYICTYVEPGENWVPSCQPTQSIKQMHC